jgi:hypothetical protein
MLPEGLAIRVPDPGFPPLLAIHFARAHSPTTRSPASAPR